MTLVCKQVLYYLLTNKSAVSFTSLGCLWFGAFFFRKSLARTKGCDKLAQIFKHLAQNDSPKKKLTLIRAPVSAAQTLTSPRSHPLTTRAPSVLTTQTTLPCCRVWRHFPLSRFHTVGSKGEKCHKSIVKKPLAKLQVDTIFPKSWCGLIATKPLNMNKSRSNKNLCSDTETLHVHAATASAALESKRDAELHPPVHALALFRRCPWHPSHLQHSAHRATTGLCLEAPGLTFYHPIPGSRHKLLFV